MSATATATQPTTAASRRAATALARRNAMEIASRSAMSSMTMNTRVAAAADLYAKYIGETTKGLNRPKLCDMTCAGAFCLCSLDERKSLDQHIETQKSTPCFDPAS